MTAINKITLESGLTVYRDWECEGAIQMVNPKTIKRYLAIQKQTSEIDLDRYGVFFAFDLPQFNEGKQMLINKGLLSPNEKLVRIGGGGFGTKQGVKALFAYYDAQHAKIRAKCDPQEVYFYEWNNHECMIDYDGDEQAIRYIIDIFGVDVAKKLHRVCDFKTVDSIAYEMNQ